MLIENKPQNEKQPQKRQTCGICHLYVKPNERYPNYLCAKCISLATDKAGKPIEFYNITHDGKGCQGKYIETGKLYRTTICFIKGIKCLAEAAYFGGIVIRPSKEKQDKPKSQTDLIPVQNT